MCVPDALSALRASSTRYGSASGAPLIRDREDKFCRGPASAAQRGSSPILDCERFGRAALRAGHPKLSATALAVTAAVCLAGARSEPALAQADFYRGKSIELIISTGPGGGLDNNARLVARHLAGHIPGHPAIVPKNMPGGGHIRAANYVFAQAPKDGTTIATFIPIFVMSYLLERSKSIQFDPAEFNWLASTSSSNSTVYTWYR
jgi:hypothetical protein